MTKIDIMLAKHYMNDKGIPTFDDVVLPCGGYIGSEEKVLYEVEEKIGNLIRRQAEELKRIHGLTDFWDEAVPEALLVVLQAYEKNTLWRLA